MMGKYKKLILSLLMYVWYGASAGVIILLFPTPYKEIIFGFCITIYIIFMLIYGYVNVLSFREKFPGVSGDVAYMSY
jgi:cobalamin synthase